MQSYFFFLEYANLLSKIIKYIYALAYMQKKYYLCGVKIRKWYIAIVMLVIWASISSCDRFERDCEQFENELHNQLRIADAIVENVCRVLNTNAFDSLWHYTHLDDKVVWYVYSGDHLVYWSSSWLSDPVYPLRKTTEWHYGLWGNAHGIYKNVVYGDYTIMVVIPLKYNYRIVTKKLNNRWIIGDLDESYRISGVGYRMTDNTYRVRGRDGKGLFWLVRDIRNTKDKDDSEAESIMDNADTAKELSEVRFENFSYQSVLVSEKNKIRSQQLVYLGVVVVMAMLLLGFAIRALVRYRGVRNLPLSSRLQLVLISTLTLALMLVFAVSVWYIRNVFVEEQRNRLEEMASHIQTSLQDLYFWDMGLNRAHSSSLNIDLRDMSLDYETDIHVYDLNGQLLGTSSPRVFDLGLVSHQMSAKAFFKSDASGVQSEHLGDVEYLSAYTTFVNGNFTTIGYISVPSLISQSEMDVYVGNFMSRLLPLYMVLMLLCIIVIWIVSRMVSYPLSALSSQMKNYHLGDAGFHVSYRYHDEVGELIRHYNEMLDALAESTKRLARSEREGAWRTMARQVAHEINNSLTPMKLTLQQLQRSKGSDRFDSAFDRSTSLLIEQIDNMSNIASSFSSFAKMPEVQVEVVDIAKKMYDYIVLLRHQSDEIPIRYIGPEQGVVVLADGSQITQVFVNIVRNAVQAMEGKMNSDIIIILKDVPREQRELNGLSIKENWVEISFSDNGPGIAEDVRDKVFIPNFTTKNTGAGLGLAISRNIVEGCDGKISFQTSEKGTTFYVYLKKVKITNNIIN